MPWPGKDPGLIALACVGSYSVRNLASRQEKRVYPHDRHYRGHLPPCWWTGIYDRRITADISQKTV